MSGRVFKMIFPCALLSLVVGCGGNGDRFSNVPVSQSLSFSELSDSVDIIRDQFGVPHIFAATAADASFVTGYLHASDRLFQMDVFRRIGSGTLSELLGAPDFQAESFPGNIGNVAQDVFFQTLRLRHFAEESLAAASPEGRETLEAYAEGVNAFIRQANENGSLPPEYAELGIARVEPWSPVDSVTFGKLQAFQLSFDFDDDPTADEAELRATLGTEAGALAYSEDLVRSAPAEQVFSVPDAEGREVAASQRRTLVQLGRQTFTQTRQQVAQLMNLPFFQPLRHRDQYGSNQWVVAGRLTDRGFPILANDPHLTLGSPPTFYEIHVNTQDRGGDLNVIGVGFAGVPGVIVGHNEHIGWGATTNPTDVTDWYLERIESDAEGNLFSIFQGQREPIERLPLEIRVNLENGNTSSEDRELLAALLQKETVSGIEDITFCSPCKFLPRFSSCPATARSFPVLSRPFPFPPTRRARP